MNKQANGRSAYHSFRAFLRFLSRYHMQIVVFVTPAILVLMVLLLQIIQYIRVMLR